MELRVVINCMVMDDIVLVREIIAVVLLGLGRIVVLYDRPSASHQIL
jgi:hypothetical protein